MKKIYALLLVIVIIFAFAGCSKKGTADVDASSETASKTIVDANSNAMPDTESKTGDAVIDINELFEDSNSSSSKTGSSTSQKASSSGVAAESSSKSGNSSTVSVSQIVGGTDTGSGYTSGWVN